MSERKPGETMFGGETYRGHQQIVPGDEDFEPAGKQLSQSEAGSFREGARRRFGRGRRRLRRMRA
jgi:hypothetical protein